MYPAIATGGNASATLGEDIGGIDARQTSAGRDITTNANPSAGGGVALAISFNATTYKKALGHRDYTIGWICALQIEVAAALAMLDEEHQPLPTSPGDINNYVLGRIQKHNVVVAYSPASGSTTINAAHMLRSFPGLLFSVSVGIGGGIPTHKNDIRLGDVVVSKPRGPFAGVIQYDFGKHNDGQFRRVGTLNNPPPSLLNAISTLEVEAITRVWEGILRS